jgi:hypothetical protein
MLALSSGKTDPHGLFSKQELLRTVSVREAMLCQECETRFSRWETYARRALYGNTPGKITKVEMGVLDSVKANSVVQAARRMQVAYAPFKLFLLSLLWRASVSRSDFFRPVHIGRSEKKLRVMLLEENPGGQFDYPCLVVDLRVEGDGMTDYIERPSSGFLGGTEIVRFVMGGYVWFFMYNGAPRNDLCMEGFIREDGSFLILVDGSGSVVREMTNSLEKAGRLPLQPFGQMLAHRKRDR